MLRIFGPGLPSDAIAHRYGFDGNEPEEVLSFYRKHRSMGIRSTFAINTWYPEIQGGYYVNRSLFEIIDQAMRDIGIYPVLNDVFRPDGLVPVEGIGQLLELEDYLLVNTNQTITGCLRISEVCGGGGAYYQDCVVIDMVLPVDLAKQMVSKVETKSRTLSISFTRAKEITSETMPRYWWFWIRRFWK